MVNIFEDTCSTCKLWQSVSRQSQFGGCQKSPECIMDRNDVCGSWEAMENSVSLLDPAEPEPEPEEPPMDAKWEDWEDFYNRLLE